MQAGARWDGRLGGGVLAEGRVALAPSLLAAGVSELEDLPCMALVECEGEVVAANRLCREMSGDWASERAAIEGLLMGAFPQASAGRQRFDCLMVRRSGRPMVVSGSAQPVVHGGRAGRLVLLMERSGAAAEDGGQSTLFESVLNSLPEAAAITFAGRIMHINVEFTVLFGYAAKECIGRDLHELTVPAALRDEIGEVALAVRSSGRASLETVRRSRGGEELAVAVQVVPLPLGGGIRGEFVTFRDIREQKLADARLQHTAMHDGLTGLANRGLYLDRLELALARMDRHSERGFSVMFLDLDGFKQANDCYGHAAGDAVLVEIAERMRACLRPEDTVARLGGDEFALLLDDTAAMRDVAMVAERIQAEVCRPVRTGEGTICVSASIGIVAGAAGYRTAEQMLKDADAAMYRAKALGRRRYVIFDGATVQGVEGTRSRDLGRYC